MKPTDEEWLQVDRQLNFASYACNGLPLIFWTYVFYRILKMQDRAKYWVLMIVCLLMMASLVSNLLDYQLWYTYEDRSINGDLSHLERLRQIVYSQGYTTAVTFNLAHWLFAFTIFTLSFKME